MAGILSSLLLTACSVIGVRSGTEEPAFTVVDRVGGVEIRRYAARAAAETTIDAPVLAARSEGFRLLAGYIFGRNAGSSKVAMTAPVAQQPVSIAMTAPVAQTEAGAGAGAVSGSTIRFFLPASLTAETAPLPLDDRVRIVTVPAETVAVLRFAGSTGVAAVAAEQQKLGAALEGSRWAAQGAPFAWFYDPPWTLPPLRRNEAVVRVVPAT